MMIRFLKRIFLGGDTPSPPTPAKEPVHHMGFDIPHRLAWRTGTLQNFTEVSQKHMDVLRTYGAISEATDIVEIGCGVGRDAIALLPKLPKDGSYLGIDIMGDSIAWAQEHITTRDPRFTFVHFDVADAQHNPGGTDTMANNSIPRDAGSTDLIFMFSVFTHMFPADVSQYLHDFARILRPGGRVVATAFIITEGLPAHLLSIGGGAVRNLTFQHEVEQGFFHNDPAKVPGATGYSIERLEEEAAVAGLKLTKFAKGSWSKSGTHETLGQDVIVFTRD